MVFYPVLTGNVIADSNFEVSITSVEEEIGREGNCYPAIYGTVINNEKDCETVLLKCTSNKFDEIRIKDIGTIEKTQEKQFRMGINSECYEDIEFSCRAECLR